MNDDLAGNRHMNSTSSANASSTGNLLAASEKHVVSTESGDLEYRIGQQKNGKRKGKYSKVGVIDNNINSNSNGNGNGNGYGNRDGDRGMHGTFHLALLKEEAGVRDGGVFGEGRGGYESEMVGAPLGRGGGVEGEVQIGGGRGDIDSDSDEDGDGRSVLVGMNGTTTLVMV